MVKQSKTASILLTIGIGGLLESLCFIFGIFEADMLHPYWIISSIIVYIFLGIFMHEFEKAQDVVKEKEKKKANSE